MAKKAVATLQTGVGKNFAKVIKMVKTKKGSYQFKEEIVHVDHVKDFFAKKQFSYILFEILSCKLSLQKMKGRLFYF